MRQDEPQTVVDEPQTVVTDPLGNPLPADHPAVVNPQIGRPVSKGDLTLPENQHIAQALSTPDLRRRDQRAMAAAEPQAEQPTVEPIEQPANQPLMRRPQAFTGTAATPPTQPAPPDQPPVGGAPANQPQQPE